MSSIETCEIIRDYFHEQVRLASFNQNIEITPCVEYYVVDLLSQFGKIHNNPAETLSSFKEKPLAFYFLEALHSDNEQERRSLLKQLGDFSLFTAGFFSDSIEQEAVDLDYYINMGSGAYGDLSTLVKKASLSETFEELARKFSNIVEVLSEVSENSGLQKNSNLLKLYEKYQQNKSPRLEKKLQELGFITHIDHKTVN